jgi:5,10-methylenetetrahydromethanopterin reductase
MSGKTYKRRNEMNARRPVRSLGLALWGTEPIERLVAHARLAEEIGFESIWVIDSQLLCREVYVTLTAIALATSRIGIGTGVTQPRTRLPSVTASAMASLNELSGGRAMLGIGTGFSSLRTLGMEPAKLSELEAYLTVTRTLLRGEAARLEGGAHGGIGWLSAPTGVPAYIAASGPRMTRAAGRIADGAILLQGVSPELLARGRGLVDEGAREAGRDPAEVDVSVWSGIGLADDPKTARDQVRGRVAGAVMNVDTSAFSGPEQDFITALRGTYDYTKHASPSASHAAHTPDSLVGRYAIAGTATEVRAQLTSVLDQPGIGRVILTPQVPGPGSFPVDVLLRGLARDVLPRL